MQRPKYHSYGILVAVGFEQVSVDTAPTSLTPPPTASHMLLLVQNQPVRWRADAAPSSTVGILLLIGDYLDWTGSDLDYQAVLNSMQFIKDTAAGAGTADLQIQYYE